MGIRVQHGDPRAIIELGKLAGQAKAARIRADRQERKEAAVRAVANQKEMAMFNAQLDLDRMKYQQISNFQAEQRAKEWEIEKMALRSQGDFARTEQQRMRKLDSIDNALLQIDKEVDAGRLSEQEAYPMKLNYELEKLGVDTPTSLLPKSQDDEQYGVKPYWMRGKDAPEGSAERKLYDAKLEETTSGERGGTIPWYLTPKWVATTAGREAQMKAEIFLEDEDIQSILEGGQGQQPLNDTLDDEPADVAVFETMVAELKKTDMAKAKAYYDKYSGRF